MIDKFPLEIIYLIIDYLSYKDFYNILFISKYINCNFSSYFKDKYHYLLVIKLVNNDLYKFRKCITILDSNKLEKVFIYTLNNINTVWLNKTQGFSNMKYILECMIIGCRINEYIKENMNTKGYHFYEHFYYDILNAVKFYNRNSIQENINNCRKLKSLHSNFIPFVKKS